jgi:hypothetical protein
MSATEMRAAVVKKYEEILGRNKYSQPRRSYAFKKYSDGKYYSDCSSSVALAYKYAGYPFYDNNKSYNPNTVGMYQAKSLKDVPVTIKNGIIQNPEVLRPGDMLLFAGTDNSRKYADCVGHVEMVGKINGTKVTLYGHGSGTPRATEMNAYCKSRYSKKTSTVIGHKGLLKVRRFIWDDTTVTPAPKQEGKQVKVTGGNVNIRTGPGTNYTAIHVAKKGEKYALPDTNGWRPIKYGGHVYWISANYSEVEG